MKLDNFCQFGADCALQQFINAFTKSEVFFLTPGMLYFFGTRLPRPRKFCSKNFYYHPFLY